MGRRVAAVIPAAGRGVRMGGAVPKQFLSLGGLPILVHSLRAFQQSPVVDTILLVVPAADSQYCQEEIVARHHLSKVVKIVPGGAQRQDSVRHGLQEVARETDVVVVHDAVRPFVTAGLIDRVIEAAAKHGAAIVAVPMRDTVKRVGDDGMIEATVQRGGLWLAQTPQAFQRGLLDDAHRKAFLDGVQGTDDAQLVERLGHRVAIVEGSGENIKMTRPEDVAIGEAILGARMKRV